MSVEELKARVTKNIQYLKQCTDYASEEAANAARDTYSVVFNIATLSDTVKAKALAKHLATLNLGKLFNDIWQSLSEFITQDGTQGYYSLCYVTLMYCNITDISDDVSKEMGEAGCLEVLIEAIDKYRDEYTDAGTLNAILLIIINAIQGCTENVSIYRRANAIAIFKRYLDDCDDMVTKVHSLIILAHIVDEEESSLLQTTNDGVGFLLSLLKDAISNKDHREHGIGETLGSALELLRGLNLLAVNDVNKRVIARLDGIPVFTKMLTNDEFSEDEQYAAVQALLNMSFIEELRTLEELQKAVEGLEELAISKNEDLQQMAARAVWKIKGHQGRKEEAPPSYEEAMTQSAQSMTPKAQVMISYQWDKQETTMKLRDRLADAGYRVWLDVTHIKGSLYDAMAKAVETSSVVIVCATEQYKNSPNCRLEAEYAQARKKPIIPLFLEPKYEPDGWLGILVLPKLHYKVFSPGDLDSNKMAEIIAGIQTALGGDAVDGVQAARQEVTAQEPSSSKKLVRQWSKDDVQNWLSANDLSQLCDAFNGLKGGYLEEMYDDMKDDRDSFKQELQDEYKMDGKTRRVFMAALKEACKD